MIHSFLCRSSLGVVLSSSLSLFACGGNQAKDQGMDSNLPENSFDQNESAAKEAEAAADERHEQSALEATEGVENVQVIEDDAGETTVDEVDTETGDTDSEY